MHITRPKVTLDYNILKWLNEYYSYSLSAEANLEKECFSAPDLDLHCCCCYAKLPGDKTCKCSHVPGRMCQITCIIYEFCLAAYAYRLGIGGDDQNTAIKENLKLKYKDLYNKVQDILESMNSKGAESTRVMSSREIDGKLPPQSTIDKLAKEAEEKGEEDMSQVPENEVVPLVEGVVMEEAPEEPEKPVEPPTMDATEIDAHMEEVARETDPLLSIQEAADLYGCTYANISHKIKAGSLLVEMDGKQKKVRKSDVIRLSEKTNKEGRRGRPRKNKK